MTFKYTILGDGKGLGEVLSWVILSDLITLKTIIVSTIGKQDNRESQMILIDESQI